MNDSKKHSQDEYIIRQILEAVSEDFEPYEVILSKVSDITTDDPATDLATELLQRILLASIADELVCAYLLHAEPPYITQVEVGPGKLECYWFYITDKGKKVLFDDAPAEEAEPVPLQPSQLG